MKSLTTPNFSEIIEWLTVALSTALVVEVGEWQAIRDDRPQTKTIEVEDISFEWTGLTRSNAAVAIQPNLPWAEDHFQERVSGVPLNPPPSHEWWPFAQADNVEHTQAGKFSHTYPERFWPKFAESLETRKGIRFDYADFSDTISLLLERPGTRQAYLPIWFPEDGMAALSGERAPCTLGYHFLVRNGQLKIVYYIRSCDFYRHFRDDAYMAARLAQLVAGRVGVAPRSLVMHISSLHVFAAERQKLESEASKIIAKGMECLYE